MALLSFGMTHTLRDVMEWRRDDVRRARLVKVSARSRNQTPAKGTRVGESHMLVIMLIRPSVLRVRMIETFEVPFLKLPAYSESRISKTHTSLDVPHVKTSISAAFGADNWLKINYQNCPTFPNRQYFISSFWRASRGQAFYFFYNR